MCQVSNILIWYFCNCKCHTTTFTDHPVHPPSRSTDPWNLEFPDDKNYLIKSKNGVFHVYKDQAGVEEMDFTYIKLDTFVQNMHTMCAMIADGPL